MMTEYHGLENIDGTWVSKNAPRLSAESEAEFQEFLRCEKSDGPVGFEMPQALARRLSDGN